MKKLIGIYTSPRGHWVGDGFPVRTLFSYDTMGKHISPFLLLDHAGPADFTPTEQRRGVGQHPHRGFETVTIVYDGEVEHRDSTGAGGTIGPGDVQWMTAAKGILHEEFHSEAFARSGGALEMVQLWVNLPAKDKMADAGYQTIVDGDIPVLPLADGAGQLRLIAGEFAGTQGPAHTFTPIDVWDLRLNAGKPVTLDLHEGRNTALVILRGTVLVNGEEVARQGQLALFERDGRQLTLEANDDAKVLLLSGEPIDEPIVGHGPFVMNTEQEIHQAFADFQSGRFGQM
ncbi:MULTISPECIES: pirin family protein [Pseudomonas]|jgi:quercetin 2,3-dioxygenase|uniref:Quercetin 2,3-dioxygenase n=1 Tax=Pseudomonas fluorescens LMG 5329 TaxID=1324332 RepID=A0A0A1YY96_PSEFL|nr:MULTISPECIES: pirin family protein [Pseudomonas]KGE65791.1 quercetin 2,3-dioxygenase [Pseudomonas fluorescens LMG 5329]NWE04234.1 pirin family protein [Pseudomonas sp. IPO3749]NWF22820.1 pirin family protein [Pseudomonas sp. IPO3749]